MRGRDADLASDAGWSSLGFVHFAGVRLSTFLWSLLVAFCPVELADLNYVEKYHVKLY